MMNVCAVATQRKDVDGDNRWLRYDIFAGMFAFSH